MKTSTAERRRERRQQNENEKLARQAEREAARDRRGGRRFITWKCRGGDLFTLDFDFSKTVVIDFDPDVDKVDDVPKRVARHALFARQRNTEEMN